MDGSTLSRAMGGTLSLSRYSEYAVDFTRAALQANCTTLNRIAMWCAQIGHESVGLRYMEEIASGAAYEGRRDLGNTQPGDGKRFKGRGPIQLTGRNNYGAFGRWCRSVGLVSDANYFVNNPAQVATSGWGFLAAAWYWTVARPNLNAQADAGDIVAATKSINGGTNGLADRTRRWNDCRAIGAALVSGINTVLSGETELDMATLNEVADIVRKYVPSGLFGTVTIPRSPDRVRTATVPVPPRNGVVTGNEGAIYASITCGENAEITEIYAEQDWQPDGARGQKFGLQGAYTLMAGDRQSVAVPEYCTQLALVYQSDADLFVGIEVDTQWK